MDYPLRLADQLRAHLQALRKRRGLTQAQLGQRLGLSQVRIAEIEARPAVVSVEQLIKIVSALGATFVLRDTAAGTPAADDENPGKVAKASTAVVAAEPAPPYRAARGAPTAPPTKGKKAPRKRARPRPEPAVAAPARGGKGSW